MDNSNHQEKGFFKTHGDALAVVGVNIAMMAIMISMWISTNSRIDAMYSIIVGILKK